MTRADPVARPGEAGVPETMARSDGAAPRIADIPSNSFFRSGCTRPTTSGGTRMLMLVPWDMAQARHREDSTLLANLLESSLRAHIPMSAQPLREAPMRVLAGLDMAAVVVELAYLTNPEQAAAAQSEDFQNRAVQGLFDAVTAFRNARGSR